MRWLNKLPNYRREPHGLEWRLLRRLPVLLLGGTLVPVLFGIASRLSPRTGAPSALAAHFQFIDIAAIALIITAWTAVLTLAIGCCVVVIMKGPAYVADRYDLSDAESPRRD
jgi:4-amino-4-deoxy-L-arabinose transferase-like glycosyltransferase